MSKVRGKSTVNRTMRDFKNFIEKESSAFKYRNGDHGYSERHATFWEKLNKIGTRNISIQPPDTVADIDATVILSNEEWTRLKSEFLQL